MNKCKAEFEDLNKWKLWFDTGDKHELIEAIELIESFIGRFGAKCENLVKIRKPFLDYAYKKMDERFEDWQEDLIPF